jgi:hypothetical protein
MEVKWMYWFEIVTTYGFWHRDMTVIQSITLMLSRAKLLLPSDEEHRIMDLCYTVTTTARNQQPD